MKSIRNILVVFFTYTILSVFVVNIAHAGALTIFVKDGRGPRPNCRIAIESDRGERRNVTSGNDGTITINLAPGTYRIQAQNSETNTHISSEPKRITIVVR
jgi:hypothetical protein